MKSRAWFSRTIGLGPLWIPRDTVIAEETPETTAKAPAVNNTAARPATVVSTAKIDAPSAPLPVPFAPKITAPLPDPDTLPSWEALQAGMHTCERCQLSLTRLNPVFGRGQPGARWLLVGEAPGANEDKQGLAFVGRAGQLLDNMLQAIGLDGNSDAFITNVLKCRPPGNRNPNGEEIVACQHFLHAQIAHLKPQLILALGRFAAQTLLDTDKNIGQLRGRLHDYQGIPLIVTFHPAYLLRNLPDKQKAWEDMVFARQTQRSLLTIHT